MSQRSLNEARGIQRLLANLREAYSSGKISEDVYDRMSKKYETQLRRLGGQIQPQNQFSMRPSFSPVAAAQPRIVGIGQATYQSKQRKFRPPIAVVIAFSALLVILILVLMLSRIGR